MHELKPVRYTPVWDATNACWLVDYCLNEVQLFLHRIEQCTFHDTIMNGGHDNTAFASTGFRFYYAFLRIKHKFVIAYLSLDTPYFSICRLIKLLNGKAGFYRL